MDRVRKIKIVKLGNWENLFFKKIKTLFDNSEFCDLTLQFLDNFQLKVHRLVLNACTDYFSMLESTCGMVGNTLLMPGDVSSEVTIAIINFLYTGSIKIDIDLYDELLKSSKDMKLTALTKLLEAHRPLPVLTEAEALKNLQSLPFKRRAEEIEVKSEKTSQVEAINLEPLDIPIKREPMDPLEDLLEEASSDEDSEEFEAPKRKRKKRCEPARAKNPCTDCNKMFKTKTALRYHIKQVYTNSCVVCHRIFNKQAEFDAHDLQACIMAQQSICPKCNKVFRSKEALSEHFQSSHNESYRKLCKVEGCNASYFGPSAEFAMKRHLQRDHSKTCQTCFKSFKSTGEMQEHWNAKHKPAQTPRSRPKEK